MGQIRIGTSSWADTDLIKSGRFYPPEINTPAKRLAYYAGIFKVSEIDSTFYAFPTKANLSLWLDNTPPDFVFNVKAFRLFSQHPTPSLSIPRVFRADLADLVHNGGNIYSKNLPDSMLDELWKVFVRAVQPIVEAGKMGCVFFQFPPWFIPKQENYDYIGECKDRIGQCRMAVEFRAGSWLGGVNKEKTTELLHRHLISFICVDEPQGFRTSLPPIAEVTAPLGIVRFHGRNPDNWEKTGASPYDKYNYLYNEDELKEWLPRIKEMARDTEELHIIFKNKHEDYPVRNAQQMIRLLA